LTGSASPASHRTVADRLRGLVYGSPMYRWMLGREQPTALLLVPPNPWPGDAARGRELIQQLQPGDAWSPELHRFEWLRDLRAVGGDAARRHARLLTQDWLDRHARFDVESWSPELLGPRLSNWIGFHDFFCASAEDGFRQHLFETAAMQSKHLARILPDGLTGAPLLAAIKGLWISALALPDGDARAAVAQRLLLRELPQQILPDGCHAQRSPRVHLTVLADLIDLRAALRMARLEIPEQLQHAIDRMAPALRFFRHGDGMLALFNDSAEGEALLLDTVLTQADAKGRPLKRAPHGGFERMSAGRTVVLLESGVPAMAGLDRTAHAGTLSFEMSVGRDRLVVNCGAYPAPRAFDGSSNDAAGDDSWRAALRGTAAHSTLTVAETNSSELKAEGLGRRPSYAATERQESEGGVLVESSHDGYAAPYGLTHRRRLFLAETGEDLRGEDTLLGQGGHEYRIRFHLHPNTDASLTQSARAVLIRTGDGGFWRFHTDHAVMVLEDSIYLGQGLPARRSVAIVLRGTTEPDETVVKWAFRRDKKH
jgi:uncharacterized heparinase superfamily protein